MKMPKSVFIGNGGAILIVTAYDHRAIEHKV